MMDCTIRLRDKGQGFELEIDFDPPLEDHMQLTPASYVGLLFAKFASRLAEEDQDALAFADRLRKESE